MSVEKVVIDHDGAVSLDTKVSDLMYEIEIVKADLDLLAYATDQESAMATEGIKSNAKLLTFIAVSVATLTIVDLVCFYLIL